MDSYVGRIIQSVVEEGKGDISNKMRQRKAQAKYKERELRKMTISELDEIASEYGNEIQIADSIHSNPDDDKEQLIQGIIYAQQE